MRLLLLDEGEPRHLVDSFTNKAAAFFQDLPLLAQRRVFRRSRASSARSSALSGTRPVASGSPRSGRAALTQVPSVVSFIPSTSSTPRLRARPPARATPCTSLAAGDDSSRREGAGGERR